MLKHPTFKHYLWLICLALTTAAHADLDTSSRVRIIASNYPLAYFAERIAGTRATVAMPVPAGEDPAFWKPSPRDIGDMQRADLILLNGADYEKWLARVSLPRLKTVDTSAAFKQDFIVIANAVTHSHGPAGTHSHAGTAFTTWLDFTQAVKQAEAVAQGLARKRPELKSQIMDNFASLRSDLETIDSELLALASANPGVPLLGSHPVYQYLARRYGLNLESVHWEPDEMPPAAEWQALQSLNHEHPARWMLWEAQPNADIEQRLKGAGVLSVVFDPCANRPEKGDFLSVMQQNKANLQRTLSVR